jgi:ferredoxin-NADP reductase
MSIEGAERSLRLEVASVRPAADGVLALILTNADGGELPCWEPGAHIDLTLPNGITRQYSLCGDTVERRRWRLGILNAPDSRGGSAYIHSQLKAGDVLKGAGPRNNFPLVAASRYLFIAGGIGITPILPMLRQAAADDTPWTLLYGGRSERSMAFRDEIAALPGGDLHFWPQDRNGLLDLETFLAAHEPGRSIYCCGPGPLIDAVEDRCRGWPAGSLHRERFTPAARPSSVDEGEFEVILARSGRRIRVPADRSLLSVLEDAGCSVTNSCRAGICGTCLVKVLGGVPEHNDDLLDDEEREAGTVMLPCVSRSKTDTLVLDL